MSDESGAARISLQERYAPVCATGRRTFVAVKPGHPAYHRW